jgi:hypothetical protein
LFFFSFVLSFQLKKFVFFFQFLCIFSPSNSNFSKSFLLLWTIFSFSKP